jgi:serine/threonine-protein kinase RsbT
MAPRDDPLPIRTSEDVVMARHAVRKMATELGFSIVDQTKIVTATSELARNTLEHGGGGEMRMETLHPEDGRRGLRLVFEDRGPGIPDLDLALKDGYTTKGGLGYGLGGARRLVNEFRIESRVGQGTRVEVVRWR